MLYVVICLLLFCFCFQKFSLVKNINGNFQRYNSDCVLGNSLQNNKIKVFTDSFNKTKLQKAINLYDKYHEMLEKF